MAKAALMDYDKALELFEPVLGFEVHVELNTKTKMFSSAPNNFGAEPEHQPVAGVPGPPGSLPVVNEQAVRHSISLGLALGCQIAESSRFARKNYFYPDLGKNYQISQYDEPIAYEGSVEVELVDGTRVTVPIERAHMEEDAGKLTHVGGSTGRIQGAGVLARRLQPRRSAARRDRHEDHLRRRAPGSRTREGVRADHPRHRARARHLRREDGARQPALRRQRVAPPAHRRRRAAGAARHAHRDEERQLDAIRRARRALRDPAPGGDPRRRRHDHPGDAALARRHRHDLARVARSRTPTTTATSRSPTCCPSSRRPS